MYNRKVGREEPIESASSVGKWVREVVRVKRSDKNISVSPQTIDTVAIDKSSIVPEPSVIECLDLSDDIKNTKIKSASTTCLNN